MFWKDENKEKEAGDGPFFKSMAAVGPAQWSAGPLKGETIQFFKMTF